MPAASRVVVVRHGETEWSANGRHTSRTDLPLVESGRERAAQLRAPLSRYSFSLVATSPLLRARETCELAGFGNEAVVDDDLREWDYGEYEGLTTPQIRETRPDWNLWRDGCPGGESPAADRRPRGPSAGSPGGGGRRGAGVRPRSHPARAVRSLALDGRRGRRALCPLPGDDQRPGLRAGDSRGPAVERAALDRWGWLGPRPWRANWSPGFFTGARFTMESGRRSVPTTWPTPAWCSILGFRRTGSRAALTPSTGSPSTVRLGPSS